MVTNGPMQSRDVIQRHGNAPHSRERECGQARHGPLIELEIGTLTVTAKPHYTPDQLVVERKKLAGLETQNARR